MKKNSLLALLLFFVSITAYAETSGNTLICPWSAYRDGNYYRETLLEISNITDVPTNVIVSFITGMDSNNNAVFLMDGDGDQETGWIRVEGDVSYYSESPQKGSLEITIKPYDTARISIIPTSGTYAKCKGYGRIDWDNDSENSFALIANLSIRDNNRYQSFMINGGDPF